MSKKDSKQTATALASPEPSMSSPTQTNNAAATPGSAKSKATPSRVAKQLFPSGSAKKGEAAKTSSAKTSAKADKEKPNASQSAKKRSSLSSSKKKLQDQEKEIMESLEKLKKEKTRVSGKLTKAKAEDKVKFPVKDELIATIDAAKPSQPLPKAHISLDMPDLTLSVWDFVNVFQKQLHLSSASWDDFHTLLSFEKPCPALYDIYCALLRVLFADHPIVLKLCAAFPKSMYFGAKVEEMDRRESILPPVPGQDFDSEYNGFKLLPRKLAADVVDALRAQVILRGILLRLEPIKRARKAVIEIQSVLTDGQTLTQGKGDMDALLLVNHQFWTASSAGTSASSASGSAAGSASVAMPTPMKLSKEVMARINTPKINSRTHRYSYINKDAIFSITQPILPYLQEVYALAQTMEHTDLHLLSVSQKVLLLKILCDACYDTQQFQHLLESNAEERNNLLSQMNKMIKESKLKAKDSTLSKRPEALQRCRQANYDALAASSAKSGTGRSASKKAIPEIGNKCYEPSAEQIQNMIDELLVLEEFQVDYSVPDFEIIPIEDDSDEEDEGAAKQRGRPRNATKEQARFRAEMRDRNDVITHTCERIDDAIERNSEKDLRGAIRAAERAGFKDEDDKGKIFCTQKLKMAYQALYDLEQKRKEDRQALQHEEALEEHFVRTEPLGSDRHHAVYWQFKGDPHRLYKQESTIQQAIAGPEPLLEEEEQSVALFKLFQSRPSNRSSTWSVYSTNTELFMLCEALDVRGEREKELKSKITAAFNVTQPEVIYATEGPYMGRKIKRTFGRKEVIGTVVGYLAATEEDPALWRVLHADGDEEDLEEHELQAGLQEDDAVIAPVQKKEEDELMDTDSEDEAAPVPLDPLIVRSNGLVKGANRLPPAIVGIPGICQELTRLATYVQTTLHKYHPKDTVGAVKTHLSELKATLRSADDFPDLRKAVLGLEAQIYTLQAVPDKKDAQQAALDKAKAKEAKAAMREEMVSEGWLFEGEQIGQRVRRFFKGFGTSDGTVLAVLPPSKSDDIILYRIAHDDGDEEDLDKEDLLRAIEHHQSNAEEDDQPQEEDEEADDEDSEVPEDIEEDNYDMFDAARLWPTYEVRRRWRACVKGAATVSELAWAIYALEQQAWQFNVLADIEATTPLLFMPEALKEAKDRTNRSARRTMQTSSSKQSGHSMLSPRKAKKRAMSEISRFADEEQVSRYPKRSSRHVQEEEEEYEDCEYTSTGRPTRGAAMRVSSYAE